VIGEPTTEEQGRKRKDRGGAEEGGGQEGGGAGGIMGTQNKGRWFGGEGRPLSK
jgi:hypothetical protein